MHKNPQSKSNTSTMKTIKITHYLPTQILYVCSSYSTIYIFRCIRFNLYFQIFKRKIAQNACDIKKMYEMLKHNAFYNIWQSNFLTRFHSLNYILENTNLHKNSRSNLI